MKKNILIIILLYFTLSLFPEEKMHMELQVKSPITADIVFSKDGVKFATVNNNNILIWNKNGRLERFIQNKDWVKTLNFSSNNRYLACTIDSYIKIFDLFTGNEKSIIPIVEWNYRVFYSSVFTPDNNHIITGVLYTQRTSFPETINATEFKNKVLKKANKQEKQILQNNYFIENNNYILNEYITHADRTKLDNFFDKIGLGTDTTRRTDSRLELWTIDGKFVKNLCVFENGEDAPVSKLIVNPNNNNFIAYSKDTGIIKIYDLNGKKINTIKATPHLLDIKFNSDGKLFGWLSQSYGMQICNLDGIFFKNIPKNVYDFNIDKEIYIELGYTYDPKNTVFNVSIRDFKNNVIRKSQDFQITFMMSKISPDLSYVVAACLDGTLKIANIKTGEIVSFVNDENDWLVYTEDGYWDCSQNGGRMIAMIQGYEAFSIDQFAVKFNRPDIILKRLGIQDKTLLNYYYNLYQKRLYRMGLSQKEIEQSNIFHIPEAKILSESQNDKSVKIKFHLKDSKYNLKSYNVYVNDVPLFDAYGKKISGKEQTFSETIELTSGKNKIEVSCINENGAESYRAVTYKNYNKNIKGNLYFIGFGVSDYKSNEIEDLIYAHKDVLDLKNLFSDLKKYYTNIYTYSFINNEVTIKNIIKAKSLLKDSSVDDTFVLFIAGHGLHDNDKNTTYYYITHDALLNNLSKSAANFELIENLLQGIPPRNKLFLMDTCESGEYFDNDIAFYDEKYKSRSIKPRSIKVLSRSGKSSSFETRDYLFENDRYIFNDLKRRSGAIVFSSSKAGQYSYEDDRLENGLFTEEIINAFKNNKADENNDNQLSVDELKKYVTEAVKKWSNNLQHPTVDRDNIYQKFSFPIPK